MLANPTVTVNSPIWLELPSYRLLDSITTKHYDVASHNQVIFEVFGRIKSITREIPK